MEYESDNDLTLPNLKRKNSTSSDDSDSEPDYGSEPDLKRKNSISSDESDSEPEYRSSRTRTIKTPVEPKTLAIGIFTHGEIVSDVVGDPIENTTFPHIYIVKHNVGGFGCVTVNFSKIDFNKFTERAYNYIDTCINPTEYITKATAAISEETVSTTVKQNRPLFSTNGVCQIFKGSTRFYEKQYMGDPSIDANTITFGLMKHGTFDCINILTCSTISLYSFITSDLPNSHEDTYDSATDSLYDDDFSDGIYKFCKSFITHRETKNRYVTTTGIFAFIELLKQTQTINKVHILDMSCNIIKAGVCDTDVCNGYKINPSGMAPNNIAFGGKTRKPTKRKRKSKRKSKRKLQNFKVTKSHK